MSDKHTDTGHRAASRVLDILELLAATPAGCPLRELSGALDAPKSSLLPLLQTLDRRGYIVQDDAGVYRLGTRILELSGGPGREADLRDIAYPEIKALAAKTGESAILATLTSDHRAVVYIDKVESLHRIRATAAVGETRPLHSTSSGRLLLAHLPAAERKAVIDAIDLTPFTEKTITSRAALGRELEKVREEGFCINIDQSLLGHCAIAAPIRDRGGEVVAACVLSAPKDRVQNTISLLVHEVCAAAGEISRHLGFRGQSETSGNQTGKSGDRAPGPWPRS
jgi:DNA-binding IclR family transcriptional regulator